MCGIAGVMYADPSRPVDPAVLRAMGQSIAHTSTVLLFDRSGKLAGTITADEPNPSAVTTLEQLVA